MEKQLYFDIYTETGGGSLYLIKDDEGKASFLFQYSTYDEQKDETKIFETSYKSFNDFWQMLTKDKQWFYQHPLFVHPNERAFIRAQLQQVNWNIQPDKKWQESHQRQWKKVLEDKNDYYRSKTL